MSDQQQIPMTYAQFAEWLIARGDDSAGRRRTRLACPLSSALYDLTGKRWLVDFLTAERLGWAQCEADGEYYALPDWAYHLAVNVDKDGVTVPITGQEAYRILTEWDEQLNKAA